MANGHRPSEACGCDGCTAMKLRLDGDWDGLAAHLRRTQAAQLARRGQEATMAMRGQSEAAALDGVALERDVAEVRALAARYPGLRLTHAIELADAAAVDRAGVGSYTLALRRREVEQEPVSGDVAAMGTLAWYAKAAVLRDRKLAREEQR